MTSEDIEQPKPDARAARAGDLLSPAARNIWISLYGEFKRLHTARGYGLLPASEHRFYVREVAKLLASNRRPAPPPAILDELARNFYVMLNGHERGL